MTNNYKEQDIKSCYGCYYSESDDSYGVYACNINGHAQDDASWNGICDKWKDINEGIREAYAKRDEEDKTNWQRHPGDE